MVLPAPLQSVRFRLRLGQSEVVHNLTHEKLVIGSHVAVDVCIKDRVASRRHAEVFVEDCRVVVRDLKSKNGTWHQQKPVSVALLDAGSCFRIGETEFHVEAIDDAASFVEDDIQTEREAFVRPPLIKTDFTEADQAPTETVPPYSVAKRQFQERYIKDILQEANFDDVKAAKIAALPVEKFVRLRKRVGAEMVERDEEPTA